MMVALQNLSIPSDTTRYTSFEGCKQAKEEEYNLLKTWVPHGRPKKKREEKATYKGTRGLQAEDVEWDNNKEAVIRADRLAIRCQNIYSICGQAGHNKTLCKTPYI